MYKNREYIDIKVVIKQIRSTQICTVLLIIIKLSVFDAWSMMYHVYVICFSIAKFNKQEVLNCR